MSIKKNLFFFALILFIFGCSKNEFVKLTYQEDTNLALFELSASKTTKPVQLGVSKDKGGIFFETKEGKKWIAGNPNKVESNGENYMAEWLIDDRTINVSFTKEEEGIKFSFSAMPDTGIIKWGMNLSATEDEYFTGVFERVVDGRQTNSWKPGITEALDLRGQAINLLVEYTLGLYAPFYISSNDYGLFIEGTWPGHYDFCKSDNRLVQVEFEGGDLSGKFYMSSNPGEIIKSYSLHIGPTIVPPEWAFRPQRWRDDHDNLDVYFDGTPADKTFNSMFVEDVLMMEALDIPMGAYWIDRPWAPGAYGYNNFEWDKERFPNAQKMLDLLNSKDISPIVWIAPWVAGDMADIAREREYNLPFRIPDSVGTIAWYRMAVENELALLDFTNPEAVEWWQNEGLAKLLNQGVKGFKMDRADEVVPFSDTVKYTNGKSSREMRNGYPVLYAKAAHDIAKKMRGDDFVLFPRAGYAGTSKYSAVWGGDITAPQEGLRCAIIAVQRSSIMGFPIWGSDIGGYWGGDLDREVTSRWLAFGCFTPIMEFGPTENRAPWDMKHEPHYDAELIAIWRLYSIVHDKLASYSHELAKEANATGMPPVRPLFLEYGDQKKSWEDWQTFTYGSDILVSAIWKKGKTTHKFYLPSGSKWKDAWNPAQVYEGGQELEMDAPLHKIPIFIKEGSDVELGDLTKIYEESLEIAGKKPSMKDLKKKIAVAIKN